MPGALEYKPGKDYHFISTSSKDDLHRRIGGMCRTNNMKIVFKVGLRHQPPQVTSVEKNKNTDTSVNQVDQDVSLKAVDNIYPEEGLVQRSVNKDKITQKNQGKSKKHRDRRKNGERKKRRRKGGRKRNHNKNQNADHRENNDILDSQGSTNSCPPSGCPLNVIESRDEFDFTSTKTFG